jgi:two-component system sensor histidine kinase UhpB
MPQRKRRLSRPTWRLSLFEKVILANTLMLACEALAGWWVTSHNLESHHYLIDTAFLVGATLLTLGINILLLRASFRPLFGLLETIRTIGAGRTHVRASVPVGSTEISELARAFNTMLDRLEAARRAQAILILQAQEEERRRIALELHDESSQNLTALLVHTEILQQSLQALPAVSLTPQAREQLRAGLVQLTGLAQRTLEGVHTLSLQLRPAVLDNLGLPAALRWLAEDCRQRLHLGVDLHLLPQSDGETACGYSPLYETTLFRVAQESLTNVARHAQATQVTLTFMEDAMQVTLRIHDNGQGYQAASRPAGLGIRGMRERVALLNGTFCLASEPGGGTTVEVVLPLLAEKAKDETYV